MYILYLLSYTGGKRKKNKKENQSSGSCIGPKFDYYPNSVKTCLLVKQSTLGHAKSMFEGTGVRIVSDGYEYFGGCMQLILLSLFEGVVQRVETWVTELKRLSEFTVSDTQLLFMVLQINGLFHLCTSQFSLHVYQMEPSVYSPSWEGHPFELIPLWLIGLRWEIWIKTFWLCQSVLEDWTFSVQWMNTGISQFQNVSGIWNPLLNIFSPTSFLNSSTVSFL